MEGEFALGAQRTRAYLARLGLERPERPTREALDELVYAHQCSIPFETIDMYRCTEPPDLEPARVFDKLVAQRRGGYCFELNALFEALLASLGYRVRPCLCRAVCGAKVKDPINHRAVLVELDGKEVLVDVGFGGPLPSASLSLADGQEQIIRGESFTARRIDAYWWAVDRVTGRKKDLYGIEGPVSHADRAGAVPGNRDGQGLRRAQPCLLPSGHGVPRPPHSEPAHAERLLSPIWDDMLTVRKDGKKERIPLPDEAAFADACEQYFGFRPHGA